MHSGLDSKGCVFIILADFGKKSNGIGLNQVTYIPDTGRKQ